MTPDKIAELKRIAEAATKGKWCAYDNRALNNAIWIGTRPFHTHAETRPGSDDVEDKCVEDAAHIVAFQPRAAMRLLQEIERLREGLETIADPPEDVGLNELPEIARALLTGAPDV